jgi:hypothetical protein
MQVRTIAGDEIWTIKFIRLDTEYHAAPLDSDIVIAKYPTFFKNGDVDWLDTNNIRQIYRAEDGWNYRVIGKMELK